MNTIQYKIVTVKDTDPSCAKCSLFFREMYDDTIVVIPTIEDEELFKRLEEYILVPTGSGYNDQSISAIEKVIENYLVEKRQQEKLRLKNIKYDVYVNVGCNECCSEDCGARRTNGIRIPKGTQQLLSNRENDIHVYVGVFPKIEDPELLNHLDIILRDIVYNIDLTTKSVITLIRKEIDYYQSRT